MNYREELIAIINGIEQEDIIKFLNSLLKSITSDPGIARGLIDIFGNN